MQRREFITFLGGAASVWPFTVRAQQVKKVPRVGVLWHAGSAEEEEVYLSALRKGFRDLGYVEGNNLQLENRFPGEQPERFRALALELVESKVDVIVAVAGIGGKEAKQATSTIPIVIATDPDPVGNGLVQSLAHPGGNVTGLSLMIIDLSDKRLGLFKELVPNLSRLAILVDPRDAFSTRIRAGYENAAKAIGLRTQTVEVTNRDNIDRALPSPKKDLMARRLSDQCCLMSGYKSASQPWRTRYPHCQGSQKWLNGACCCLTDRMSLNTCEEPLATLTRY